MRKKKGKRFKDSGVDSTNSKVNNPESDTIELQTIDWRHIVIIAVLAFSVHSNTLFMDFVSDDLYQIKDNMLITSLKNIPEFFTTEVWKGVKGGDNITPYYRPVFTLSYSIDYFFWGKRPFGYHLTNVMLHLLVSVLVFALSFKILKNKTTALYSGLLFAVHPVHSEAITWIAARNESIAALFMLSSLYLYILFRDRGKRILLYVSLVLFMVALLSKEISVTLPLLILLYEACFCTDAWRIKLKWSVLYGLILIPYFLIRSAVLEISSWQQVPLLWRVYTSFEILVKYVQLLILPVDLKVYYDIPIEKTLVNPRVMMSLVILIATLSLIIIIKRRNRELFFGLLWIFIAAIPVSGIPTLILPAPMAERYLYVPSVGFTIAAALFIHILIDTVSKAKKTILPNFLVKKANVSIKILSISVIILFFILNFQRNYAWKDQFSYAKMVVKDAPNSEGGHNDLGVEYAKKGRIEDAINELRIALKIKPDFAEALSNLSILYRRQNRFDEAIAVLHESIKIRPRNPSALNNLGLVYTELGRFDDAIREFSSALKIEPSYAEVHNNLGVVYLKQGQLNEAVKELKLALQLEPNYAEAYNNLGVTYLRMGRIYEAKREFQKALMIKPDYTSASDNLAQLEHLDKSNTEESANVHYNRGNELLSQGRVNEAIQAYRTALKLKPDDAEAYNNLGAAYVKLGQLEEAARVFERSLKLRPNDAMIHYNLGLVYMKQGKMEKSVKHLRTAVSLKPDRELFKKTLSKAYELQK